MLTRPRIESLLDLAQTRRLVVVVADAGFGKSTLLATWANRHRVAWCSVAPDAHGLRWVASGILDALSLRVPRLAREVGDLIDAAGANEESDDDLERADALAAAMATALQRAMSRDLVLVVDDVHEMGRQTAGVRLVEGLCRLAPPLLHIVLASREPLPFAIDRMRLRGQVLDIAGSVLAFTEAETAALFEAVLGEGDPALVARVRERTGGWPAAVRLAAEALAGEPATGRAAALERLLGSAGGVFDGLADEALANEPPETLRVIEALALFDRASPGMLQAAGLAGAGSVLAGLERRGLYVQAAGEGEWYSLHPLVRTRVLERLAGDPGAARSAADTRQRAADWLIDGGSDREALEVLIAAGDTGRLVATLRERGPALVAAGEAAIVLRAARATGSAADSPGLALVIGSALQARGEWDAALDRFAAITPPTGPIPAGLAWRVGLIHHLRGDLDSALATYARGDRDRGDPVDRGQLGAWWASALWLRGDVDRCRHVATDALADAAAAGDDGALAAAHTVLAMLAATDGDRRANDAHYLRALAHAEAAGDALQVIRIHTNRGSRLVEEGDYREAVEELGTAIRLAEVTGFSAFRALALSNRGEALTRLGRLEEAVSDLVESRALYQRLGSRMVCYPLGHLGEVYRQRGQRQLARASFEEAVAVAEQAGDLQGLVPALAGLARVEAEDDPGRALGLAERAVLHSPALGHVGALLAQGWVRLTAGDRAGARTNAVRASALARSRRDRAGVAEAIELDVASERDPELAADRLTEALAVWRDCGAALAAGRVEASIERLRDPARTAARVPPSPVSAAAPLEAPREVRIGTLGSFRVVGPAGPVPAAAWGSRKARDLVKVLVCRRGLATPRDQLIEALWPGEPPDRGARRLSVLLSSARRAIDPEHALPPDAVLAGDATTVRLVVERAEVDVLQFLGLAAAAFSGAEPDAAALQAVAAAYTGDFLEDDPYLDWAVGLREEARAAFTRSLRALAGLAAGAGRLDEAIGWQRRLLERDPYDEEASLSLVRALHATGRPGAARRAYQGYVRRMADLDVEPAPFPA